MGATKLDGPGVYADPAGHPFCLIPRPKWAPPVPSLDAIWPGWHGAVTFPGRSVPTVGA